MEPPGGNLRNRTLLNHSPNVPLALGIESFFQLYKFGASSIDSNFDQADLMVLVDNNLNMSHQFSTGLMAY